MPGIYTRLLSEAVTNESSKVLNFTGVVKTPDIMFYGADGVPDTSVIDYWVTNSTSPDTQITVFLNGNQTGFLTAFSSDRIKVATELVGDSGAGGRPGIVPAPEAGDAAADKFLKADGTWANISAAPANIFTSIVNTDTIVTVSINNSTYTTIPGITLTPPAGAYWIEFVGSGQVNNNGTDARMAIFRDGTLEGGEMYFENNRYTSMSTGAKITVNGSEELTVRVIRVEGAGSVGFRQRFLSATEVT